MQSRDGRDDAMDRLLRQAMTRRPDVPPGACLDAETLAAWTDGALAPAEAAHAESHLSSCTRCQAMLAALVRTSPAPEPEPAPPFWERWRLQWLVPAAASAAAVLVWLATMPGAPQQASTGARLEAPDTRALAETPGQEFGEASSQERGAASAPAVESEQLTAPAAPPPQPATSASADIARLEDSAAARERAEARAVPPDLNATAAAAAPPPPPTPTAPQPQAVNETATLAFRAAAAIEILSPDPSVRWRFRSGLVERTVNAGQTWSVARVVPPTALTGGSASDALTCWLVGPAGAVRLAVDGVTFQRVAFPETADLVAVEASNARSAVVTTADGRRLRTEDQGATWTLAP